jgi:YD repeat-containing protein
MTYDGLGRTAQVSMDAFAGAPAITLDYAYDANGNLLSVTDLIDGIERGRSVYRYDALDRMVRVAQDGSGVVARRAAVLRLLPAASTTTVRGGSPESCMPMPAARSRRTSRPGTSSGGWWP